MEKNNIDDALYALTKTINKQVEGVTVGIDLARVCRELQISLGGHQGAVLRLFLEQCYRCHRKMSSNEAIWQLIFEEATNTLERKPRRLETETDKVLLLFRFVFEASHGYSRAIKFGRAAATCFLAGMKTAEFGEALMRDGIEVLIQNASLVLPRSGKQKADIAKLEDDFREVAANRGGYYPALEAKRLEAAANDSANLAHLENESDDDWDYDDNSVVLHIHTDCEATLRKVIEMDEGSECKILVRIDHKRNDGWVRLSALAYEFDG